MQHFFSKNFALLEVHLFITVVVMSLSTFIMYYKSFPEQTFKIILNLTNNMSPKLTVASENTIEY